MYYTYIIYSSTIDKFYVGQCQDLNKRLEDHNNSRSTFTRGGKPWELQWYKQFETRTEAIQEELKIKKKKSRKYIEWLVSSAG